MSFILSSPHPISSRLLVETSTADTARHVYNHQVQNIISDTLKGTGKADNPNELIPDVELAQFFALGAQLAVVEGLAGQDLRFKVCFERQTCRMLSVSYVNLERIPK